MDSRAAAVNSGAAAVNSGAATVNSGAAVHRAAVYRAAAPAGSGLHEKRRWLGDRRLRDPNRRSLCRQRHRQTEAESDERQSNDARPHGDLLCLRWAFRTAICRPQPKRQALHASPAKQGLRQLFGIHGRGNSWTLVPRRLTAA
jgi:hypothetical protein